jgi:outer membrane protein OmpA-like peptidoglycan-associated protein
MSLALALLGGCASVPPGPPPEVVRLQHELDRLHQDQRVAPNAPDELREADAAVTTLTIEANHLDPPVYEHRVYVTDRLIQTAEAQGLARYAEVRAKNLGVERDRLVAEARTRDLRNAQATANNALAAAETERRNAELARSEAAQSRDEVEALRADLQDLQAQQTQRGLMVTLGDFLFETGRAELKPGAERELDGLVRVLHDDPSATMEIDGHTDSVGNRNYNVDLSLRRAQAVKDYLALRGIDPTRITTQGLGPDYPVASNATEAGRQQNRRVEVIVADSRTRADRNLRQ